MKLVSIITAAMLSAIIILTSCEGSGDKLPEAYIGLEKSSLTHFYDSQNSEETIGIKIIVADKEKTDRVVKLSISGLVPPGETAFFKLDESQLTIKADSKSASTLVRLNPKKAIKNTFIQVVCTPQVKDAKSSQLSIRLLPK